MKRLFPGCLLNPQFLIVIAVESVESISIVHHHIEQGTAILCKFLLILDCPTKDLHQLAQFIVFLCSDTFVDSIAIQ